MQKHITAPFSLSLKQEEQPQLKVVSGDPVLWTLADTCVCIFAWINIITVPSCKNSRTKWF